MLGTMPTSPSMTRNPVELRQLIQMALHGLSSMFYPEKNLFCYRLNQSPEGLVKEGLSYRYTLMTLLGLRRSTTAGFHSPIDRQSVLSDLHRDTTWIANGGDLGLYLWLSALDSPDVLERIVPNLSRDALGRFPDILQCRSMELAWVLSGLSHAQLAKPGKNGNVTDLAKWVYDLLVANQGSSGIFGHQSGRRTMGILRGRIGTFADQVYPIYALSKFAEAFQMQDALERAECCAHAICENQGPLGQWWWHYDASTGRVVRPYPVYAVHQDAMAPLALFALSEVSGTSFDRFVYKGLEWISGQNELRIDLRELDRGFVWRSLYQNRPREYASEILGLLGLPSSSRGLRIKFEDRPYHLGWLLYAFAERAAAVPHPNAVTV
jgi:hypothetical protein